MQRISSIWALLRVGKKVSDPAKWKNRQITATALTAAIWAAIHAASAWGVDIPADAETVDAIAVAAIGVVNVVLTISTSDTVGLRAKPDEHLDLPAKQ